MKQIDNPEEQGNLFKRDEPSLEQWQKLFEAAAAIKKLAPWDFFWDTDLVTIQLPEYEEPTFCSVMGRIGECYAIGVYHGYDAFNSFSRIAHCDEDDLFPTSMFEQQCLLCHFGDREEVCAEDRAVYKALDLKFRGRGAWIFFRSMEPGTIPWHINAGEADLLIGALQNLFIACQHRQMGKVEADFENGETIMRFFSPDEEQWITGVAQLPAIKETLSYVRIEDEMLIARLKKKKPNHRQLEWELTYLPMPVRDNEKARPRFPVFLLLADSQSSMILNQHLSGSMEGIESAAIGMLADYIEKSGKPSAIYVRSERAAGYIADLCEKTGIKLICDEGVPIIDELLADMLETMSWE